MNPNPVSNGFVNPLLTEEEKGKIEEVRKLVGPLPEKLSSFCSDDAVLRNLRARNWHVKKAAKMLKETLKWRVEYKPEEICWEEIADEAETGKIYRSSCVDKHGRPVLVMRPSVENSKSVKGQIRYLVYCMENAIQNLPPGEEQMVWMIDFSGYSLANVSLRTTRETAHILQQHYPERLSFAILYNPPKFFEPFWMVAKPFLEPKTRNKVKFVYSDDPNTKQIMEENFDMDKIETAFGGNEDSGFNINKHSERMKEDDKKRLAALEDNPSASLESLSFISVSDGTASDSARPGSEDVSEDDEHQPRRNGSIP
uniref:Random slug protein 5 n=1 Tax=Noccaea caerulescens TaxID=107243 RepID=A0A1J3JVM0_NOCCA